MRPERRYYPAADQTTREVALKSRIAGDLYVSVGEARLREDGSTAFEVRAQYHPLIWMLGWGAVFIVGGGAMALTGRLQSRAPVRGASPASARMEPAE
jgi:cytochrome c-type biogenesis protein CcmF